MDSQRFILNNLFKRNAKTYQTKPVRATKYQPGMETGFAVYMTNRIVNGLSADQHEGMVFFDTEQEAWDYMEEETTTIDESETVTSDKCENLILKILNNPKIVEDVNQLRQSAHLSDAIAVKILKVCLK